MPDTPETKSALETAPARSADSPSALRALMEKNLKWSQIIYEQNRKINRKLLSAAIAQWLRTLIFIIPIILAIWYLPGVWRKLQNQFNLFLPASGPAAAVPNAAGLSQIIRSLPLNEAQRKELERILK